ncbi:MAG: sigma factor [archaeon]|nr:sigma factor [archaeon]
MPRPKKPAAKPPKGTQKKPARAPPLTASRKRLAENNLGLAFSLSGKFWAKNRRQMVALRITPDDLLAEAMSAIVTAARGFKPSKGFAFSTYAYSSIKPRFINLIKLRNRQLHIKGSNILSLDSLVKGKGSSEHPLYSLIPHRASIGPAQLKHALVNAVNSLNVSERDKHIFFVNTGLLSGFPVALEETGRMFGGLSRERVRQIGKRIMLLLKKNRDLLALWESK